MILDEIIKNKKKEVARLKVDKPLALLKKAVLKLRKNKPRFAAALKKGREVAVIAEMKRRSPSKGLLRKNFDPIRIAKAYKAGGARALSVLTDEKYFGGSSKDLTQVRKATNLPILRKDFTVDEYQIYESKLLGADAILLIAAVLSPSVLKRFSRLAKKLGMDALIEIHTAGEFKKVSSLRPALLGINNRNLKNFHVDIRTTQKIAKLSPKKSLLISESGIKDHGDLMFMERLGVQAVLVGESLMKKPDLKKALLQLRGMSRG